MQPFRTYLVNRQSSKYTVCLILVLLAINILQNRVFGIQVKGLLGNYGLPFLSWAFFVAFIFWLPRVRSREASTAAVADMASTCVRIDNHLRIYGSGCYERFRQKPL